MSTFLKSGPAIALCMVVAGLLPVAAAHGCDGSYNMLGGIETCTNGSEVEVNAGIGVFPIKWIAV